MPYESGKQNKGFRHPLLSSPSMYSTSEPKDQNAVNRKNERKAKGKKGLRKQGKKGTGRGGGGHAQTNKHQGYLDHGGIVACYGCLFLCFLLDVLLRLLVFEDRLELGLGGLADVVDDDSDDDQDICDRVHLVDLKMEGEGR